MFEGSCVALVTPMTPEGEIDEKSLIELVEWHIAQGTAAIVVAGSTGESATLTVEEQQRIIALVNRCVQRRIPVIAGTGTCSTAQTIARTLAVQDMDVDACLIVAPYFNRPTQEGLIQHFSHIANAVDIPILLYNVPTRTACDLKPATVAALSKFSNIIGIKEATGNLQCLHELREMCDPDFVFYSGDDPTALDFIRQGGKGVISITANVVPNLMQKMCQYALAKEDENAQILNDVLSTLHQQLIIEANPIPVKWALNYLGKIQSGIRLPLTTLSG